MAEGDLDDPVDYGSIVRNNLMKRPGYAPYCSGRVRVGENFRDTSCLTGFSRMVWDGAQFGCPCGCRTEFAEDFITKYKERWRK